jgi:hypothetical protein
MTDEEFRRLAKVVNVECAQVARKERRIA